MFIERRFSKYRRLECKSQIRLYNSFKKYGTNNHLFTIIQICNKNELDKLERYYQDKYKVLTKKGLNCLLTETSSLPRVILSKTREKQRLGRLGKKHTIESRLKMSISQKKIKTKKEKILKGKFTRKVKCTRTGIIYNSIKECAEENNIHPATLCKKLNGTRKNNTTFKYYNI